MNRKWWALGGTVGPALLLALVLVAYVKGAPRRNMHQTLQAYEKAVQAGDPAGVLKVTAPTTVAAIQTSIDRALNDTRAELQSRSMAEIIEILSLRAQFRTSELASLRPAEVIRRRFAKPEPPFEGTLTIRDVEIEGDQASGWLAIDDGEGTYVGMGLGTFFYRIEGQWLFDWHAMNTAAMSTFTGALDDRQKFKIIEESIRKEHPNADLPSLWRRPTP